MKRFLLALIISFSPLLPTLAEPIAKIYSLQGTVDVKRAGNGDWAKSSKGEMLSLTDEIRTGLNSRVGIKFQGGKLLRLRENSHLVIENPNDKKGGGSLNLLSGAVHLFSRKSKEFPRVRTPEVSASIRGTEFVVETRNKETSVTVLQGAVDLENSHGEVSLGKGELGFVKKDSAPAKRLVIDPLAAVQWTFRLPQVLSEKDLGTVTDSEKDALKKLSYGNTSGALNIITKDTHSTFNKLFLESYINLSLGNTKRGIELLEKSSKKANTPEEKSLIYSLEALLALLSNENSAAAILSKKALKNNENSIIAHVVHSLILQGNGSVSDALKVAAKALEIDPHNSYTLARVAELKLGTGDTKEALYFAESAVTLAPHDAYARGVLGFTYLSRLESKKAIESFQDGLKLEDNNGLLHLGLGLGMIHQGDLGNGRGEIEKAVHLEPNISLYRSYLGKAFFEEEDEDLASNEYEMAIALDPKDPTPYLYRAFNKLSNNRVPSALKDVEESIKRNDARAVYRSKLLLDQDKSTRTTSLAEVFNQLGFSKVARLEAIKSINSDYSNFAAHRLYADSLEGSFLGDARFTQNVISDLLSPVSFNVFQNFNGFSNDPSLNDYAALFDRPGHRGEYSFSGSNFNDLYKGSTVQTGKVGNFGYMGSYATDYGRGRKTGGDYLRTHKFNLASNVQITPEDRLILQTGYTRVEDNEFDSNFELEDFEASIGSHHKLSARSEVISRFEYFNRNINNFEYDIAETASQNIFADGMVMPFDETELFLDQMTDEDQRTLRASLQHIYQTENFTLITGGQYLHSKGDGDEESTITGDSLTYFNGLDRMRNSSGAFDTDSYSAYSYSTIHIGEKVDVNLGVNYTEIGLPQYDVIAPFADGRRRDNALLPKAGITLYPNDRTIVRTAYFQTLGIANISDIGSIEPTLVGGFNQIFGDLPGAKAENFNIGIDHKVPSKFYFGAQYTYRDLERDQISNESIFTLNADDVTDTQSLSTSTLEESELEHIFNAYFYAVLGESSSATLDYERILLESADIDETNDTDRVRARINYFSKTRWFGFSQVAFYNQQRSNVEGFTDGNEDFWLVDAGVGYRLPKRHGALQFVVKNIFNQDFAFADRGRIDPITNDLAGVLEFSVNF